jgi:hypothetical protein
MTDAADQPVMKRKIVAQHGRGHRERDAVILAAGVLLAVVLAGVLLHAG